jgi:hypothetical protein
MQTLMRDYMDELCTNTHLCRKQGTVFPSYLYYGELILINLLSHRDWRNIPFKQCLIAFILFSFKKEEQTTALSATSHGPA